MLEYMLSDVVLRYKLLIYFIVSLQVNNNCNILWRNKILKSEKKIKTYPPLVKMFWFIMSLAIFSKVRTQLHNYQNMYYCQ